jgi:hypothetical protein
MIPIGIVAPPLAAAPVDALEVAPVDALDVELLLPAELQAVAVKSMTVAAAPMK